MIDRIANGCKLYIHLSHHCMYVSFFYFLSANYTINRNAIHDIGNPCVCLLLYLEHKKTPPADHALGNVVQINPLYTAPQSQEVAECKGTTARRGPKHLTCSPCMRCQKEVSGSPITVNYSIIEEESQEEHCLLLIKCCPVTISFW